MHSGKFWNILHAFCNTLEHSACILEHSGTFWKPFVISCKLLYSFALHLFPVLYCLALSCTVLFCTVLYCLVLSCTVWYSLVQSGTVWYSLVQSGTVWYS